MNREFFSHLTPIVHHTSSFVRWWWRRSGWDEMNVCLAEERERERERECAINAHSLLEEKKEGESKERVFLSHSLFVCFSRLHSIISNAVVGCISYSHSLDSHSNLIIEWIFSSSIQSWSWTRYHHVLSIRSRENRTGKNSVARSNNWRKWFIDRIDYYFLSWINNLVFSLLIERICIFILRCKWRWVCLDHFLMINFIFKIRSSHICVSIGVTISSSSFLINCTLTECPWWLNLRNMHQLVE